MEIMKRKVSSIYSFNYKSFTYQIEKSDHYLPIGGMVHVVVKDGEVTDVSYEGEKLTFYKKYKCYKGKYRNYLDEWLEKPEKKPTQRPLDHPWRKNKGKEEYA